MREARKDDERRELSAKLESAYGRLLSETAALKQEFDCFKVYHAGQMEQKEKKNQELVMLGRREHDAAVASAEQKRAAADAAAAAAAIRAEELLAEAKKEVENEVAARKAAEDNAKRLQALLAKVEEVHPTPHTLHLTLYTLHPTP
jgi:hypothetical protein